MKLISFLIFFFFAFYANAQWVDIPDENFRKALKELFPNCFNSNNQLNTNCNDIKSCTILNLKRKNIKNLEGIKHFPNLEELNCSYNSLVSIPVLPLKLKYFDCSHNEIQTFSNLPANLLELDCSYNQIKTLPTLPNFIRIFYCVENQITGFSNLPEKLDDFDCSYNQLVELPSFNTKDELLVKIDCSHNSKLKCLPDLPESVKELLISGTQIQCIPNKPKKLNKELPICSTKCK
jgi:Leucine-rich repeat (LRR) protein